MLLKGTLRSRTPPPIKRVQTNFSCESAKCESCHSEAQQCSYLEEDEKHACFVVWSTSRKNRTTILHRGCWPAHEKLELCANNNGTHCVSGRPHPWSDGRGEDVYFCCCETEMCNKNFEYDPKAEPLDAKHLVPILNENPISRLKTNRTVTVPPAFTSDINSVVYVFASILAFVILSIIFYFVYRKFRQRFYSHYDHTHKHRFGVLSSCYSLLFGAGKKRNDDNSDYGEAISLNKPEIELGEMISRGRYGKVYVAKYKTTNCTVAVKVFSSQHAQSWVDECAVCKIPAMRQCKNILHFIDMDVRRTKNAPDEYWLITEYHQNGSIFDFLKSHTITFVELLHISKTMLTGLAFLHEERATKDDESDKPTIVHRDFKSKNVLLKNDLTACIADFGLALQCERDRMPNKTHNQVGTYSYMAPEVLESALEYSVFAFKQVDVYAAALVLWELLSRCDFGNGQVVEEHKLPYERELKETKPSLATVRTHVATNRGRPHFMPSWLQNSICLAFCQTITEMWDQEPEARISAGCALQRLQSLEILLCSRTTATSHTSGNNAMEEDSLLLDYANNRQQTNTNNALNNHDPSSSNNNPAPISIFNAR